jgi:AraC-like DNA-binding protein/quercetin dioxygenase-like cupin family protein
MTQKSYWSDIMVQIAVKKYDNEDFKIEKLPVLLYAGQISNEPDWKFPSHKHDDLCELVYISEGEGEFIINNKYFRACKGDIMVYNRGVIHDEKSDPLNPLRTYFCGIGNLKINGLDEGFIIPSTFLPLIHTNKYMHKVENYISDIFEECSSQVLGYEIVANNLLTSLIILLTRIISTQSLSTAHLETSSLSYQIKEYIDKNYTQDISLNEIANRIYVSQHYMSHIFKQETGYSPINYLINRRLGEAKKLLLTTDMNIFEISTRVGYENPNYFTMLFKKATGISPSKFRESNAH